MSFDCFISDSGCCGSTLTPGDIGEVVGRDRRFLRSGPGKSWRKLHQVVTPDAAAAGNAISFILFPAFLRGDLADEADEVAIGDEIDAEQILVVDLDAQVSARGP